MKNVLITGTSKGIGIEISLVFGRDGYKVFATMRNTSMANDFEQSIANESSKNSPPPKLPMLQD